MFRRRRVGLWWTCGLWWLGGLLSCATGCVEDPLHQGLCPTGDGPKVLVDSYHSRKQNHQDYALKKGEYNYQGVFGYSRAFAHLTRHGFQVDALRSKRLTEVCMRGYGAIFINLLHDDRPTFSAQEIVALQDYVRQGGGLFVIADHTNVYRHAERLNPLLSPMGIEVLYSTATDEPPSYAIEGNGWIKIFNFTPHPVTRGLTLISLQTGGALKTAAGVAFSSKSSFADFWDEKDPNGFYGDWQYNGDPKREPKGPLAVVAATTFGSGRVVVAGDQNMFGDAWIHFGDNFKLFMNAIAWTTRQDQKTPHLSDLRPKGLHILLDQRHGQDNMGKTSEQNYYSLFAHLNRDREIVARGAPILDHRSEVLWQLSPVAIFSAEYIKELRRFLSGGKTVIVSFEADQIPAATLQLLSELVPTLSLEVGGKVYRLNQPEQQALLSTRGIPRVQGNFVVESSIAAARGLELGTLAVVGEDKKKRQTLLALRADWGSSLISSQIDSRTVDIARVGKIGEGTLILFVQDGFWRNSTLGNRATVPPTSQSEGAVALLYAFLDYLKGR